MKRYVMGDIHGQPKALKQCFERSGFDMEKDMLICLGDVCDRGPGVRESIDMLLKIKNLVYILGNHDKWFLNWALYGYQEYIWLYQGGEQSINSYRDGKVPDEHIALFRNAPMYFLLENRLFVHAGIDPALSLEEQNEFNLLWNRDMVEYAFEIKDKEGLDLNVPFSEIFVGHTPTINYGSTEPIFVKGIWLLDTGAGWGAKLTIMDIDSKEFWQSDKLGRE